MDTRQSALRLRPPCPSLAVGLLLLTPAAAWAQTTAAGPQLSEPVVVAPAAPGPEWGGSDHSAAAVTALGCSTFSQSDTWVSVGGTPNRYLTSGAFECPVSLPTGARVSTIQIEACDSSPSGQVTGYFLTTTSAGGGSEVLGSLTTGDPYDGGCAWFPLEIAPVTIANGTQKYWFQIDNSTTDGTTLFAAARVYYRVQVSPAPATATFGDVPTSSPFFRFVEALAASGITGGCGGGNFCPGSPITRGQMAVFLAAALGLHWPD